MAGHESWGEMGIHVVTELKRLNSNLEALTNQHHDENRNLWMEIAALKVRAGLWGVLGGVLAVLPTLIYFVMTKH